MLKRFVVMLAIIASFQMHRVNGFKFSITRDLSETNPLEKSNWCFVEIIENENEKVLVKVDIPLTIAYSGIFIYFANDQKEILKVNLNETVEGKFYEIPYKLVKEMTGEKREIVEKNNFDRVSGEFPKSWLPNNCSKVSATVECVDGRILNYYGIKNLKISFPDLFILEEFKNYKLD